MQARQDPKSGTGGAATGRGKLGKPRERRGNAEDKQQCPQPDLAAALRGVRRAAEGLPAAVHEALVREVARLVQRGVALGDVEAEVEVLERPATTQLELFQDRVGADAEAG